MNFWASASERMIISASRIIPPFSWRELPGLLKRTDKAILTVRDLTLDLSNLTLVYEGRREELTKNETRILACLMKKELCTRDEIIEDLWNNSLYVDDNTLSVNINRLRES